jgi:hypothetical protein
VKKVSQELRAVAIRNEWTIVTATQIKREAVGSNDMGMEDVAESFGLIHTVDTLFGLMRPPLEHIMKIKVVVNRDGGHTESYARFDMKYDNARLVELTGANDTYYSDDDQTAEFAEELNESYKRHQPSIEQELAGMLLSDVDQANDHDADRIESQPINPSMLALHNELSAPKSTQQEDTPSWQENDGEDIDAAEARQEQRATEQYLAENLDALAEDDGLDSLTSISDDGGGGLDSLPPVIRKTSEYDDILNSL